MRPHPHGRVWDKRNYFWVSNLTRRSFIWWRPRDLGPESWWMEMHLDQVKWYLVFGLKNRAQKGTEKKSWKFISHRVLGKRKAAMYGSEVTDGSELRPWGRYPRCMAGSGHEPNWMLLFWGLVLLVKWRWSCKMWLSISGTEPGMGKGAETKGNTAKCENYIQDKC